MSRKAKTTKRKRILRDIIIPAGTVFESCCGLGRSYGMDNFQATIGLTNDSCGDLVYCVDPLDPLLKDWFVDI